MQLYLIKPSQTSRVSISKQSNPRKSKRAQSRQRPGQAANNHETVQDQNTKEKQGKASKHERLKNITG